MSEWDPKKVPGEYNPHIGANTPFNSDVSIPSVSDSYADLDYLRNSINTLLSEAKLFNTRLEEEISEFALPVGDYDSRLVESHNKEWPSSLGEIKNQVSYRYYKALRFRNTTSATYIRKRYEEAARGVTGTNAIDVLDIVKIIRDETLLIQEFLNANIGNVDDSSEHRVLELFQDWVQSAIGDIREFWAFFETGQTSTESLNPEEINRATEDEARRGQVVFKVKLNTYNNSIQKDLDFLKKNFSEFAPDFYVRFLGPALRYRLQVGRKSLPTGNWLTQEIENASAALDTNLRTVFSDQLRRKNLFSAKMKSIRDNMKQRDKYRIYIQQLAIRGNPIPATGPGLMTQVAETDAEVEYWYEEEIKTTEEFDSGSFIARHSELEGLLDDHHPQYLLRSGGTITGDIAMEPGTHIDGMRPSAHKHTGVDGSPQIRGEDIIGQTLSEDVIDTSLRPPVPTNLKVLHHRLNTRPPGITVVDTTIQWEGSHDYIYDIQLVQVRR